MLMESLVSVSLLSTNECPTRSQGMGLSGSQGMGSAGSNRGWVQQGMGPTGSQGMGPTGSQGMVIRPQSCQALSDPYFICFCFLVSDISFPVVIWTTHIFYMVFFVVVCTMGAFAAMCGFLYRTVLFLCFGCMALHVWGPVLAVLFKKHPCCTVLALLCPLLFSGLLREMSWFCSSAPNVSGCPDKRD